jgi:aminoglycoside 3-N-acetyltransferase
MEQLLKKILPPKVVQFLKNRRIKRKNNKLKKLPSLSISQLEDIIRNKLGIKEGDVVLIHSSLGNLNLNCSPFEVLDLLLKIVGENGTILFPTYPKLTSLKFLEAEKVFNINKTPSYMGILSELARRHPKAVRSLHPTKSVVAIGKYAVELTNEHSESIYPYGEQSPYYKINNYNGKIIGIGVTTRYLSSIHCVDDFMKGAFPVLPYDERVFDATCIDSLGNEKRVSTFAHEMSKMGFDLPRFIKKYLNNDICEDIDIDGMKFFRAESNLLFKKMISLAEDGITIYKKRFYK